MKKLNAKGFSAVEGLLILVIVGMICGVGYYVYQAQDKGVTENQSSFAASTKTADADELESLPVEELVIKEWGVKIPKESSVAGLTYTVHDKGVFYFRSAALDKFPVGDKNCENSIYLVRGTANEKVISGTSDGDKTFEATYAGTDLYRNDSASSGHVAVKIGSYYYVEPAFGGASCTGANHDKNQKETQARLAIAKALNAMVAK